MKKEIKIHITNFFANIILLSISIIGGYFFIHDILLLKSSILNKEMLIIFDKGTSYLLGASIGAMLLVVFGIFAYYFNDRYDSLQLNKVFSYLAITSLVILLVFPQLLSFFVHNHVEKIAYIKCKEQSDSGLKFSTYVFAKDEKTCKTYIK